MTGAVVCEATKIGFRVNTRKMELTKMKSENTSHVVVEKETTQHVDENVNGIPRI